MFSLKRGKLLPASLLPMALLLFAAEWVRGAYLLSFLPAYGVRHASGGVAIVGLAVSAHYLADSLVKAPVGYWMDRRSPKTVLLAGILLTAAGFAISLAAATGGMTVLGTALMGVGLSPVWLAALRHVREENRAARMGALYAFWMAGLGLGPVTMNLMLGAGANAAAAALAAIVGAGGAIAAFGRFETEAPAPVERAPVKQQFRLMRDNLRSNRLLLPAIVLQTLGAGIIVPFLSSFASERLLLTGSELSLVMVLGGACVVLLLVPMGKWCDAAKSRWFLIGGFGSFAAALAGLTAVRSLAGASVLAVAMGISYAMLLPAWNTLLARHVPAESPSMGWGMLSTLEGVGTIVGPLVGSWVVARGSLASPFVLCAVLYAVIGLSYLLMPAESFGGRSASDTSRA